MAKKITTLYIDSTSLRLMVIQGKQIQEWAELPLEPGLFNNTVIVDEAGFTDKLKQLFRVQKIETRKIIVGISGFRCLTRPITLPRLSRDMLVEAVKREAGRTLPVPLEQLYISWQVLSTTEEKTQVFLSAIPRDTADSLLKTLHQAGFKPSFINLKPLLLGSAVGEKTAIILDFQTTEFDIVIMANSIPQPVRTIPFPIGATRAEKLSQVSSELDRTITFYNTNNPANPLEAGLPIFASGDMPDKEEAFQTLSNEVGHPILPISSPIKCPEGLQLDRYLTNIGLALQQITGKTDSPSINLNVLPEPYRPKPAPVASILVIPGISLVIAVIIYMVILIQGISTEMSSALIQFNDTTGILQQRQAQSQELNGSITELRRKITETEASRDSFTATLGSLEREGSGMNLDLETAMIALPGGSSLTGISHRDNILTVTGQAPSEKEVLSYFKNLNESGRFGNITIANMANVEDEGMNFTIISSIITSDDESGSLEVVMGNLPATITLTSVSSTDGTLTVSGKSPDEDRVLEYLGNLESSHSFNEITISSMTRTEDGGLDFSLALKIGE